MPKQWGAHGFFPACFRMCMSMRVHLDTPVVSHVGLDITFVKYMQYFTFYMLSVRLCTHIQTLVRIGAVFSFYQRRSLLRIALWMPEQPCSSDIPSVLPRCSSAAWLISAPMGSRVFGRLLWSDEPLRLLVIQHVFQIFLKMMLDLWNHLSKESKKRVSETRTVSLIIRTNQCKNEW